MSANAASSCPSCADNRFLAVLHQKLGPRPDPHDYADDPDGHCDACAVGQQVRHAELLLRRSVESQRTGAALDAAGFGDAPLAPLFDAKNRLVSATTGKPQNDVAGFDDPPIWTPPSPSAQGDR